MLVCVQCGSKSPERQLLLTKVCTCFYTYTKHFFSLLIFNINWWNTFSYFVGIVWIVVDMDSLFIRESSVGSLLNICYPLTRWGIYDQIWPNFGAPQWGFWPKIFLKSQMPHICPGSPPSGLTLIHAYSKRQTIKMWRCEDYLHQVNNTRHRIALTKLQLSNHKLAIETGRYSRPFKKPAERTCPICKVEMEDEYHFLNICPAYQEKWSSLLDYLENEFVNRIYIQQHKRFGFFIQSLVTRHLIRRWSTTWILKNSMVFSRSW